MDSWTERILTSPSHFPFKTTSRSLPRASDRRPAGGAVPLRWSFLPTCLLSPAPARPWRGWPRTPSSSPGGEHGGRPRLLRSLSSERGQRSSLSWHQRSAIFSCSFTRTRLLSALTSCCSPPYEAMTPHPPGPAWPRPLPVSFPRLCRRRTTKQSRSCACRP